MNIVFIIIMVVGILLFAASYFVPSGEEETTSLNFQSSSKSEPAISKTVAAPAKTANESIEAAKKKAREAISEDYKFDLHLTDSSDRTVEELEHDLLSGLNLDDNAPAENASASKASGNTNSGNANKGNKNTSGKKGKKKNTPKNDRYDDLLFVDETANSAQGAEKTVEDVVKGISGNSGNTNNVSNNNSNNSNSNKSQSSKGGKKGKKK